MIYQTVFCRFTCACGFAMSARSSRALLEHITAHQQHAGHDERVSELVANVARMRFDAIARKHGKSK